jgi:hypothetical protein
MMPDEFEQSFDELVSSLETNFEALVISDPNAILEMLMVAFRFAVQSTKHPSFKEEREWRVIYTPTLLQRQGRMTDEQLLRIPTEVLSIGGVPQRIYAIPFVDWPEEGFTGATPPALLDRVLIGPSNDSYAIAQAFVAELSRLNVPDAHTKVVITGVPIRH